ncbi:MAG: hypothetical protein KKD77_21850 [Gammaproteobacteria bacterium]|nr:hypothetical protein [Gammaproteobacteria bacterium]
MKNKNPKDLVECIKYLLKNSENLEDFKKGKEDIISLYHHTTGRGIRNEWGLWDEKSKLHQFFKSIGIWHADDISGIILTTLHRILNHKQVRLKEQVEYYQKYWKTITLPDMKIKGI